MLTTGNIEAKLKFYAFVGTKSQFFYENKVKMITLQ